MIAKAYSNSTIAQEEMFGPELCASKFRNEDGAVTQANATECGLAAYVQAHNLDVAHRMVRSLRAGTVFVNEAAPASHAASPFAVSGFGREGGWAGLEELIRIRGVGMSIRSS